MVDRSTSLKQDSNSSFSDDGVSSCSTHLEFLLCLQVTEAHSESVKDQEWLDHFKHILHQKVGLTDFIFSPIIGLL